MSWLARSACWTFGRNGAPVQANSAATGRIASGLSEGGCTMVVSDEREVGQAMADKMETECPDCGAKLRLTLEDLARQRTVRCSRGHNVKLKDEGGGARKASKALSDLEKSLKKFGT